MISSHFQFHILLQCLSFKSLNSWIPHRNLHTKSFSLRVFHWLYLQYDFQFQPSPHSALCKLDFPTIYVILKKAIGKHFSLSWHSFPSKHDIFLTKMFSNFKNSKFGRVLYLNFLRYVSGCGDWFNFKIWHFSPSLHFSHRNL